ncbi:MAG: BolA family transcriptional regulator [Rhodocyclaceae bacterium]|nr:BolA family transcriptional regulator [Rhodocyclaceae bacterium]
MNRVDWLRERLARLEPISLEIRDESDQHAGHAGARQGGHYAVTIVAACFANLPTVRRHRLVYDAVGDLMQNGIHALSIVAKAPQEL